MFDPAPEALRLNRILSTHKASDMVISLLQITHKAKIVPCTTLMDLHYCFMCLIYDSDNEPKEMGTHA